jgi:phage protein U
MMVLLWSRTNTDAIKEKDRTKFKGSGETTITLSRIALDMLGTGQKASRVRYAMVGREWESIGGVGVKDGWKRGWKWV